MEYVWLAIAGFFVGGLAKFFMPGKDPGGVVVTILIGIAGTFVGFFIRSIVGGGHDAQFSFTSPLDWLFSIGGAVILLVIWRNILGPMLAKNQ